MRIAQLAVDDAVDRLLIVSDIHAYAQPLEAFDALRARMPGQSQVIFNGDLFAGGFEPVEALEWVRRRAGALCVMGNHDEAMLGAGDEADAAPNSEAAARRQLAPEQIDYVRGWPHRLDLSWRGRAIRLMHGHITPTGFPGSWVAPPQRQLQHFAHPDVDLAVVSHTHWPFIAEHDGCALANTGAMSLPILAVSDKTGTWPQTGAAQVDTDAERRSSFLAVTASDGRLQPELVHFDWDRAAAVRRLEQDHSPGRAWRRHWIETGIVDFTITD